MCRHPLLAVDRGLKLNKNGQYVRDIRFINTQNRSYEELKRFYGDKLLMLPCGHCYSCSKAYAREWSSRMIIESKYHEYNTFITLTYDDEHCPKELNKRDFQLFMKRLRKEYGEGIRFFACGELGDKSGRPHYHAIIFGLDFDDKKELKRSNSGLMIYTSEKLSKLWTFGISSIGDVTPESCQYVAKYAVKRKITGIDSGEFVLMSRRPGIGYQGKDFDLYKTDKLYLNGQTYKVPRYLDKLNEDSFDLLMAKEERLKRMRLLPDVMYQDKFNIKEKHLIFADENAIYNDSLKVRIL